jgi:hypothetical protein
MIYDAPAPISVILKEFQPRTPSFFASAIGVGLAESLHASDDILDWKSCGAGQVMGRYIYDAMFVSDGEHDGPETDIRPATVERAGHDAVE